MPKYIPDGIYGVVMTPFKANGQIDEILQQRELQFCMETSVTGLLICGSTSEFIYMETQQMKTALSMAMECVGSKKVLIGGASGATEEKALEYLFYLKDLGYQYAILCPPYYYPQSPENILDFYRTVSEKAPAGIQLLLYHIPFCAPGIPLSVLQELLECDNIIGMKDSSGDMLYFTKAISIVKERRPEFAVFSGQDAVLLPTLSVGGSGCMSALAWMLDYCDRTVLEAFRNKDLECAGQMQQFIVRLVRQLDKISFPENYRALSSVLGIDIGPFQRNFRGLCGESLEMWKMETKEILLSRLSGRLGGKDEEGIEYFYGGHADSRKYDRLRQHTE